ncbi:pyridoxamine 5'-phosphate oxidase family protein [Actinomycetaceae bacterium WB03_NA08]|uniref:Pyridoxamine 5'-phosphate oxidase family protein n=1 Tax=Scrofimicrobium canadense TaxID=2652290 RepID=A0A6N7W5E5_9ACTO|nr:pyridoxamine 5'-phosphate oxidase family protein [Scrofimicrobium canadense]MSS83436.1 pyridoxamine 5'-phosphate oxidase family protein [Scrofimicrobium canadense]
MTRDDFVAFVRQVSEGVIATVNRSGKPEAALVGLASNDAGELIFSSLTYSRKIRNIAATPHIALVVGRDDGLAVQVEGTAKILEGTQRHEYGMEYLRQFPRSQALASTYALVRITPEWMRSCDVRKGELVIDECSYWDD